MRVAGTSAWHHRCPQTAVRSRLLRASLALGLAREAGTAALEPRAAQAATEAEALAWSTPYPLLFLPVLMEEKVHEARRWAARQRDILDRQRHLATNAANN